jgi:hypothetical protein
VGVGKKGGKTEMRLRAIRSSGFRTKIFHNYGVASCLGSSLLKESPQKLSLDVIGLSHNFLRFVSPTKALA